MFGKAKISALYILYVSGLVYCLVLSWGLLPAMSWGYYSNQEKRGKDEK